MKKTLYALSLFLFVPFVGLRPATQALAGPPCSSGGEGGPQTSGGGPAKGLFAAAEVVPAAGVNVPGYLFAVAFQDPLADLDVRDAQNRPISTPKARQKLASLFLQNLFELTIVVPAHGMREVIQSAQAVSLLLLKSFYSCAQQLWVTLQAALAPPKKRFVHNVHNLWITIAIGILLACGLAQRFSQLRPSLLLPLRC